MKKVLSNHWFYFIVLTSITVLVFYPSVNTGFVNWDDSELITGNLRIRSLSIENLKTIFCQFYWYNYQPLTLLSFAAENVFFKLNPAVIHFDNLVLHALNVLLVFYFVFLISGKTDAAFIASLLFALHPTRVESVAWASERKDVLYSFFFLLSLIFYLRYLYIRFPLLSTYQSAFAGKSSANCRTKTFFPVFLFFSSLSFNYSLSILFFILACLSKGLAVSLSLIIVAVDYLLCRKRDKAAILDKISFFTISLFFGILVILAFDNERSHIGEIYPLSEKVAYAANGILFYLWKFFFPVNLSVFYPYPYPPGQIPVYYYGFIAGFAIITVCFFLSVKFTRKLLFGYVFFLAAIFFVLQLKQTNRAWVADHYAYIPYLGFFYLAGEFYHFIIHRNIGLMKKYKVAVQVSAAALIISFGLLSRERIKVWQNSITLWSDLIVTFPEYYMGYHNRGTTFAEMGNYDGAIRDFTMAIEKNPDFYEPYLNRANAFVLLKEYKQAVDDYTRVIELNPNKSEVFSNRGNARWILSDHAGACDDWKKASAMGFADAKKMIENYCNE